MANLLFWNVDTQKDFVEPDGKLYVSGAELLKPIWHKLSVLAKEKSIRIVNTADYHFPVSVELSDNPDFITTFPPHCMAGTSGAEYIEETKPVNPFIFDWDKSYQNLTTILDVEVNQDIIIRKDAFDVFKGNPNTENIVKVLALKTVVVYGVTTNVCVNDAVVGLAKRVESVYVVEDAIKELPNIPLPFDSWKKLGVELVHSSTISQII